MVSDKEIRTNWKTIKAHILKRWDKLNPADVEQTKGRSDQLKRLVEDHYGHSERFEYDYQNICEEYQHASRNQSHDKNTGSVGQPYRSPDMVDGWKKGNGMQVGSQSGKSTETAGENPGTDSTWGYQGLDTNTEESDINPGGQTNSKEPQNFISTNDQNISDRSYLEAPDEFSSNQDPNLKKVTDTTLGGVQSSATFSSADNAAYYLFGDHSRSTRKL